MMRSSDRAYHLKQLASVKRRSSTIAQHVVVASVLAFQTHLMGCDPEERIEPEDRDGDLRQKLGECIEPLHVCHLMNQHEASPLLGPAVGVLRQKHCWINDAPRHRNGEPVAAK